MWTRKINLGIKGLETYRKDKGILTEEERGHLETKFYIYKVLDTGNQEVEDDLQE